MVIKVKLRYLILAMGVILLLFVSGCGKEKVSSNIVEELHGEDGSEDVVIEEAVAEESAEEVGDEENLSTKELIEKLSKEAGLISDDEEETEEEVSDETGPEIKEIVIENFKANPKDLSIKVGDTVRWTNLMPNFKHIIIILPDGDGTYSSRYINDVQDILLDESYEYTFNEAGKYKCGSKTKFDKVWGIITVS